MVIEVVSAGSLREGDRFLLDGVVYLVVGTHLAPGAVTVDVESDAFPGAALPFPFALGDPVERIVP